MDVEAVGALAAGFAARLAGALAVAGAAARLVAGFEAAVALDAADLAAARVAD